MTVPRVPLVEALAAFQNLTVATEGTGALIHGPVDQNILDSLHAIDGVGRLRTAQR